MRVCYFLQRWGSTSMFTYGVFRTHWRPSVTTNGILGWTHLGSSRIFLFIVKPNGITFICIVLIKYQVSQVSNFYSKIYLIGWIKKIANMSCYSIKLLTFPFCFLPNIYIITCVPSFLSHCLNQCWGSVTFWYGSGSADHYLWLMDLTHFFSDFKDAKKKYFLNIFFYNLPIGTLSSVLKISIFFKNFILQALFQFAQHLFEKREGSRSVPLTNGSDSGRPKTCWSGSGSGSSSGFGSQTLVWQQFWLPSTVFYV